MTRAILTLPKKKQDIPLPEQTQSRSTTNQQNNDDQINPDVPGWVADYMGLPFTEHGRDRAGVDCWGVVRLVLAEQFNIKTPSYAGDYGSVTDEERIAHLIKSTLGFWTPVHPPRAGDCVLSRIRKQPSHVGVIVVPGWMLHILHNDCVSLACYDSLRWHSRIIGYYRHAERDFDGPADRMTAYHMQ